MNRTVIVLGLAVLVLVAGLYWKMSSEASEPKKVVASGGDSADQATTVPSAGSASGHKPIVKPVVDKTSPKAVAGTDDGSAQPKWEKSSAEFNHKVDVVIGDKFRAFGAFKCDESGIDPDGKVRVNYTIRIRDGVVSATNIKATGERGAEKLARCIEDSIQNAEFEMPRMPDFEEETDLFIRVRTLKKYRSRAEFDD